MNIIANMLSLWVWGRIAGELGLGLWGRCLSLLAIFVNFYFLKFRSFYPASTDDVSLLIGLLQFWFFLKRNLVGLLVTTAIGACTWSTALWVGILLAVFPRATASPPSTSRSSLRASVTVATAVSACFLLISILLLQRGVWADRLNPPPIMELLPCSAVIAVLTLWLGLVPLWDDRRLYSLPLLSKSFNPRNAVLAGCVALAVKILGWRLTDPTAGTHMLHLKRLVSDMTLLSVGKPGISLLSLLVFWGPALWLIVFYWRTACRSIQQMGIGSTLVATAGVALAMVTEPRYVLNILPMVVLLAIRAIETQIPARLLCWVLTPACLFASRFWYTINVPGQPFGRPLEYPAQRFHMSFGCWMSTSSYLLQLPLALLFGVGVYIACFWHAREPRASVSAGPGAVLEQSVHGARVTPAA
jgi:hypothetical protein